MSLSVEKRCLPAIEFGENPLGFSSEKSFGHQQPPPMAKVAPVDVNRNKPSYHAGDSFVSPRPARGAAAGILCGQGDP